MIYQVTTIHKSNKLALEYVGKIRPDTCIEVKIVKCRVFLLLYGDLETIKLGFDGSKKIGFFDDYIVEPLVKVGIE